MKKSLLIATAFAAAALSAPVLAADVGVSVSIGEPGFYGRLDIGGFPAPALIYPEPIIVRPVTVPGPPIYLRVPPGHARHWSRYCGYYNACGRRVYFVQDRWYNDEYRPRYRERHGYRHEERREERWDHDHEGGYRDHGHGHGRGHDR